MVLLLEHKNYFFSRQLTQNMTVNNKSRVRDECVESKNSSFDIKTPKIMVSRHTGKSNLLVLFMDENFNQYFFTLVGMIGTGTFDG